MTSQLNTQTCGISMKHDPHGYVITTTGTTPWLVVCAGHAAKTVTPVASPIPETQKGTTP